MQQRARDVPAGSRKGQTAAELRAKAVIQQAYPEPGGKEEMNERIQLDESSEEFQAIKKEWQERARKMTIAELPSFLTEITEKYSHDYGTICHAVATAAIAAAWALSIILHKEE